MKIKSLTDLHSIAAYFQRIGADPRSLRSAVIKEQRGAYWKDIAVITVSKTGDVKAPEEYAPTESEAVQIKAECAGAQWPEIKKLPNLFDLPEMLKNAKSEDIFTFRDGDGMITMVQQRIDNSEGGKAYVPWTYWDDGVWRRMEPEGKLPIYGLEQLKQHAVVFIHEGAKAARRMQRMVSKETAQDAEDLKNHPWGEEMAHAAHVGWIGGALSPWRTDWSMINKLGAKKVYIVSDNDDAGISAVPEISRHLRVPTFHIQFTNEWPASFDLADDFPEDMFKMISGIRHYNGPTFRTCTHPATWATDQIPNPSGKGKPITVLRDSFKNQWAYVEESDLFVNTLMPEILRNQEVLNKMLSAFSHVSNVCSLIVREYSGRNTKLCYRPDIKGRIVSDKSTSAVNLHRPTEIKPVAGDPTPWLDYLKYMFPIETERKEVERFCATIIARPDVKMEYGLLLVSETQGIGKTTLGAQILAPLVGYHNTGYPSEDDIVNSNFNGWLAHKRLIVIGEIYSGHSWKAYNRLKSYITDKEIEVNQKYQTPYLVENWAHIVASSNSRRALKIEQDDRRWFYPEVAEVPWGKGNFKNFYDWLNSGGLQIIMNWAKGYGDYVSVGERAPMTEMKSEMIEGSRSEAQKELVDLCDALKSEETVVAFAMKEIKAWLIERPSVRAVHDTDYEIRKAAKDVGWKQYHKRMKIGGQLQYVILSPSLAHAIKNKKLDEVGELAMIREKVKHPSEMTQSNM